MSHSNWMRLFTSRMSGMFWIVTASWVSRVAQITCSASFFAPCGVMVPLSRCPPSMMNDAILGYFFFLFFLLSSTAEILLNLKAFRSSWMTPSVKCARSSATFSSSIEPCPHVIRSRFIWLAV